MGATLIKNTILMRKMYRNYWFHLLKSPYIIEQHVCVCISFEKCFLLFIVQWNLRWPLLVPFKVDQLIHVAKLRKPHGTEKCKCVTLSYADVEFRLQRERLSNWKESTQSCQWTGTWCTVMSWLSSGNSSRISMLEKDGGDWARSSSVNKWGFRPM